MTSLVFLSIFLPKADLGTLQSFRRRLLWHYLKADYPLNKDLCLQSCGVLYAPMNAINILQLEKKSSPNEFIYDFKLTSVKKKETHGWEILIESFK